MSVDIELEALNIIKTKQVDYQTGRCCSRSCVFLFGFLNSTTEVADRNQTHWGKTKLDLHLWPQVPRNLLNELL